MHERIFRKDYRASEFLVDTVDLVFELDPARTIVKAKMQLRQNPDERDRRSALAQAFANDRYGPDEASARLEDFLTKRRTALEG